MNINKNSLTKASRRIRSHFALPSFCILHFAFCACLLQGQTATQTLILNVGWNAVWLEVEPVYQEGDVIDGQPLLAGDVRIGMTKAPQDVFANNIDDISTILTPLQLTGLSTTFAVAPHAAPAYNSSEWQEWDRSALPDSNDLALMFGNRAYLIQTTTPFSLTLTGKAGFFRPTWTPDRYSLIGFGLEGTPDFDTFWGPSGTTHPVNRIYRLDPATGEWQTVLGSDTMQSNEAYWVFCDGPSDYMGPVAVDFDQTIIGALNFGGPSDAVTVGSGVDELTLDLEEIVFTNLAQTDATPELELESVDEAVGSGSLNLHVVTPTPGSLTWDRGNQVDSTVGGGAGAGLQETVSARSSAILTLGAQRSWSLGSVERTNLYRLKTGTNSASFWLPISALNSDVQAATNLIPADPAATVAGLWVGEVIVDAVTSIVEDGAPVRPASASAPLRMLLHSDATGAVSLLSQVTVMQTKSADSEVEPIPVLVTDPAQIPFFEGIRERNGKRVGLRLEGVAYDMPRDTSVVAQAEDPVDPGTDDLIDVIIAESTSPSTTWLSGKDLYTDRNSVDQAAIDSYLLFRSIRPPTLKESYHLSWPVNGAIGEGKTVETEIALDPFHRSNPFRHAFHPQHARGPNITRTMTIVFDSEATVTDRLSGTFTETIQGLIQSDLTLTGYVNFQRVSDVDTLQ